MPPETRLGSPPATAFRASTRPLLSDLNLKPTDLNLLYADLLADDRIGGEGV